MALIGAVPRDGGSDVRVFAPTATSLRVRGDFNHWEETTAVPLTRDGDFWAGHVPGLVGGGRYELLVGRGGHDLVRFDPAARDVDSSSLETYRHKSSVVDPRYDWSPFTTPAFEDLILYECHVGSFCGRGDDHGVGPDGVATFPQLQTKLGYIRELGFNAIALLPVQEFHFDHGWGYDPAFYFALESAYGSPQELRELVDACHRTGLAVIFDVVFNHVTKKDDVLSHFDEQGESCYLSSHQTDWGPAPAFWRSGVREFFVENMAMYLQEYNGDGLRFDATRTIEGARGWGNDGWEFLQHLTWVAKERFPGTYLIAEHIEDHESIVSSAGFHATWTDAPFNCIKAGLDRFDPVGNIEVAVGSSFGPGRTYPYSWNTVKYLLGSHDNCGDNENGHKDRHHFVTRFGGRGNRYARAKARMAWALNVAGTGTPMMFMGGECHLDGYWHDGPDDNGDHRFDWYVAGDHVGIEMRRFVRAANETRWNHRALRDGGLEVTHRDPHGVVAVKRWTDDGDVVLVIANASDTVHTGRSYGVVTGQSGQWQQILCSQDAWFGGWDSTGNAFHEPWTQADGCVYVNVPQWSVTMLRLL